MKKTVALLLFALLLASMLFSCSAPEEGLPSIILSKSNLTLCVGDEYTLTATVYPKPETAPEMEWISSREEVATCVDGKIVAKKEGSTVIKAICDGVNTSSVVVNVTDTVSRRNMLTGSTSALNAVTYNALFGEGEYTWETSDEAVIEIADDKIVANGPGVAEVRATSAIGSVSVCTVSVFDTVEDAVSFAAPELPLTVDYMGTVAEVCEISLSVVDEGNFENEKLLATLTVKHRKISSAGDGNVAFCIVLYSGEKGYCDTYKITASGAEIGDVITREEIFYVDVSSGARTFWVTVVPVQQL